MKTTNNGYDTPDQKSMDIETSEIDQINNKSIDHAFRLSTFAAVEEEKEMTPYDYRFASYLLMGTESDSHGRHEFYEINEPPNIFYHYSKANDYSDTPWYQYQKLEEKHNELSEEAAISLSMTLSKKEELDPEFGIEDYRFVSYFLMESARDLDRYYQRDENQNNFYDELGSPDDYFNG